MTSPIPTPTEAAALLRRAIAAELEAAQTEAAALARLTETEAQYVTASEDESPMSTTEAAYKYVTAEQTHFAARRAHLAAIDRVKSAEAWTDCHAKEAACLWTGAKPNTPTT